MSDLSSLGIPARSSSLLDDYETDSSSHPWHVSLLVPGEKSPFCAGTLISDVHVLTAAHCHNDEKYVERIK